MDIKDYYQLFRENKSRVDRRSEFRAVHIKKYFHINVNKFPIEIL